MVKSDVYNTHAAVLWLARVHMPITAKIQPTLCLRTCSNYYVYTMFLDPVTKVRMHAAALEACQPSLLTYAKACPLRKSDPRSSCPSEPVQ